MEPIPKSSLYYPNKTARLAILSVEDVLGKKGVNTILHRANLPHLIDQYPPDDLALEFDFSDFSAITGAIEELYGSNGLHGLALLAGKTAFDKSIRNLGALGGVGNPAFRILPISAKLHIGIPTIARVFSQFSDQFSSAEEMHGQFIFSIHRCPVCWGRKTIKPTCYFVIGMLQAGVKWISGVNGFRIVQTRAHSCGEPTCEFTIEFNPVAQAPG
jgi:hypothetical protein